MYKRMDSDKSRSRNEVRKLIFNDKAKVLRTLSWEKTRHFEY